ncbi:Ketose-bisphosphate aldolase, class-II [Moorella glycerini]|uniref:Fructose-bisphosphate aldolase n=1 Tax=Neomoorella stamsii TaxID=1266720 RepID=A0A9X7J5V8_9FIRM|nr:MULTISPECIES: class II fructose-bisphosphate aldolase [Moorella]PRR77510.1 Fructose-bisphosphate aldolase [Moorella stamsii]CEP68259.1 Ketose-bisphosphate aldolase, class-II [Moorella glycerini]
MPLVDSKGMLVFALNNRFAVGAFNAYNLEMAQGIVEAAEEEDAPVIVQISQGALEYASEQCYAGFVRALAEAASVPVACHLDHGVTFEVVIRCLRAGFTSLMFDGSALPLEENIRVTRELVRIAHAAGVPLEGEIGKIPDAAKGPLTPEERRKFLTTPEEAVQFVEGTGVDALAVAVGSAHRMRVQAADLDIERIALLREKVGLPLVLHGASGVRDASLKEAILAGIAKVNFATELNKAFTSGLREKLAQDPDVVDVRKYGVLARDRVKEVVKEKINILGAARRGREVLSFISNFYSGRVSADMPGAIE